MRITEAGLRRLIRRALNERMGMSYEGTPEMQLLRDAYEDPDLMPEDVRHLTFRVRLGRAESIEIVDSVIHAGHAPVVISLGLARSAGTDLPAVLDMLEALGARRAGR